MSQLVGSFQRRLHALQLEHLPYIVGQLFRTFVRSEMSASLVYTGVHDVAQCPAKPR